MDEDICPVCGDRFVHVEEESAPSADEGADATIEVTDLCAVDEKTRWDRICQLATGVCADDGTYRPTLRTFRHHWASVDTED